ncbi:MAG: hypothetical protein JXA11_08155 [Phycisphaerae bacterium]|nr:hypothetical protein [Phycisphaerae bacterium]
MKRKLLLLVGSFIILLLAFGTYQLFVPGLAFFNPMGGTRIRPSSLIDTPGGKPGITRAKAVTFYYRNPEGQLRGVYKAASWRKEDDGSFVLEHPEAVVYQRDGTRVYLRADRGRFWAEEVAGGTGFNIRHGQADGRVEIFYDQSTDDKYRGEERPHPKDRPYDEMIRDVIRIVTTDVKFDQDMLELRTESEVTIWSRQLDMNGEGLLLQWNEEPRELRLLRLDKGNILVVKELPEQVDVTQIPTKETPTTQPAKKTPPPVAKTKTQPATEDGWGLVETATETQPEVRPGGDVNIIVTKPAPDAAELSVPAPARRPEAPKMRNIYQATFHKSVRVFSGNRSLTGADKLGLAFEWDRAWKPEDETDSTPAPTTKKATPKSKTVASGKGKSAPASQPTTGPTSQPKFASPVAAAGVRDMKLNEQQARSSDTQMAIYWDGPLEILPLGRTETPSRKRYTISGSGQQIRLTDEDARILCTKFEFKNPRQEAWFEGTKESPSRVQLARGDEITCQGRIRFVRSEGKAHLDGPGELVRYAKDEDMSNWNLVPVEQAPWRLLLDRVTWAEKVEASFGERKIRTADGKSETRPYIKDAAFFENVKMVQFVKPTPRGEDSEKKSFVEASNRLQVWMGVTDEGKNYPTKVEADGRVYALQKGSDIQADCVTVEFQPAPPEPEKEEQTALAPKPEPTLPAPTEQAEEEVKTTSLDAAKIAKTEKASEVDEADSADDTRDDPLSALGGSVDPTVIKASGDVSVTYHRGKEPDEPPLRIEADMMDVDVTRGLAVLTGAPAKVWQGDRNIEGEVINFDRNAEAVKITGKGQLRFYTNQDLSGNRLAKPRPVKIDWADWMLYHGQAGQCVFDRDVKFDSAGEKISCPRQMRIFFRPRKSDASKDSQPVPRGDRSLSMGIDDFSAAKFSRIEADGAQDVNQWVRMESTRQHPMNDQWVLQRMQIRGKQILYDDVKGFAYVNGPGDFLAEDYRKPEKKTDEQRELSSLNEIGGQIDRPSQTLFRWQKAMALNQTSRHVRLQDGVEMVHYSGNKRIKLPGLQTQPFGDLKEGRISKLRAGVLDAWFGEPKSKLPARDEHGRIRESDPEGGQDLLQAGPEFGKLQKFKAEKDVTMEMADDGSRYGTTSIDGEKIFYDDVRKVIEVTGFPEGQADRTDAQITIEDRNAGVPPKTVRAPVLIYDLKNDRIQVPRMTGGGGR